MTEKKKMTEQALEKLYKATLSRLEEDLKDLGDCDHSVGLCYCDQKILCDNYRLLLGFPYVDYSDRNWKPFVYEWEY
jgi:hypothetical protein